MAKTIGYTLIIHLLGCFLALNSIRQYNISKLKDERRISLLSAIFGLLYFIVEYDAYRIGDLPDDLTQTSVEEAVPDCSKHFDNYLFCDREVDIDCDIVGGWAKIKNN